MKHLFLILFLSFLSAQVYSNDTLMLVNSHVFVGKVKSVKDCNVTFKSNKTTYVIPADSIYAIKFGNVNDEIYIDIVKDSLSQRQLCMRGTNDAESLYNKGFGHFALGVLFGPFALVGVIASTPTPLKSQDTMTFSENKEYFGNFYYLECYRQKAKSKNASAVLLGFATWVAFVLLAIK